MKITEKGIKPTKPNQCEQIVITEYLLLIN